MCIMHAFSTDLSNTTPINCSIKMTDETVTIINELSCFVQNNSNITPYEMIVKLTSDSYDKEQIEKAKYIIFKL